MIASPFSVFVIRKADKTSLKSVSSEAISTIAYVPYLSKQINSCAQSTAPIVYALATCAIILAAYCKSTILGILVSVK